MRRYLLAPFLLLACSAFSFAEQKVEFDGYEMHYIVLNTTVLSPAIASTYDIVRSGRRAFINLAILKQTDDGYGTPVAADINALQRTLVGQRLDIKLTEIREADAIYYIGSFQILDREMLWFDIDLVVEDGPSFDFTFSDQVWQE